jgi:hypothetical protein
VTRHIGIPRWLCDLLGMASVALLGVESAAAYTAARRGRQGERGADGVGCCAEHDDLPWPVVVLQHTGDEVTVRNGEAVAQLLTQSVHATQDGQTYWCCKTDATGRCPPEPAPASTRCVFYAVGM